ncbi:hypothetical protein KY334_04015 [Candidatus Woesearchaeota archaeon]|nr:hypothetical protein [Candidatus Woesearchaeota archaeon]
MGSFKKTLKLAEKALKEGDLEKCRDICEEHSSLYVEQDLQFEGIMSKLRKNIHIYVENLTELGNKKINFSEEEAQKKLDESFEALEKIKKYIKTLNKNGKIEFF